MEVECSIAFCLRSWYFRRTHFVKLPPNYWSRFLVEMFWWPMIWSFGTSSALSASQAWEVIVDVLLLYVTYVHLCRILCPVLRYPYVAVLGNKSYRIVSDGWTCAMAVYLGVHCRPRHGRWLSFLTGIVCANHFGADLSARNHLRCADMASSRSIAAIGRLSSRVVARWQFCDFDTTIWFGLSHLKCYARHHDTELERLFVRFVCVCVCVRASER